MNIRSVLFGTAAALVGFTGAHAADAIVAAEPEPMEYVRVCDAFGTGFFYIPGTETCLKIGGYVRFQVDWDDTNADKNWDARTRALLNFDARTDTELGALRSYIAVRGWASSDYGRPTTDAGTTFEIDEAYITLGGFKVGYMYNYWDNDLSGETDDIGSNRVNAIGYEYDGGSFTAGLFAEELTRSYSDRDNTVYGDNSAVGLDGQISGTFGPVTAYLLGAYDFAAEDGSIRGIVSADVGPGAFSVAGIWSSGVNAYYDLSEWTVAAQYAAKFGKFTITPAFQYWGTIDVNASGDFAGDRDMWRAGVTLDYAITDGLAFKTTVNYTKADDDGTGADDDVWNGFVRLQRTF
jgi:hypothetical protein